MLARREIFAEEVAEHEMEQRTTNRSTSQPGMTSTTSSAEGGRARSHSPHGSPTPCNHPDCQAHHTGGGHSHSHGPQHSHHSGHPHASHHPEHSHSHSEQSGIMGEDDVLKKRQKDAEAAMKAKGAGEGGMSKGKAPGS